MITQKYIYEILIVKTLNVILLITINTLNTYDIIIDSFKRFYPETKPILFFDEIQSLKNWHLFGS